MSSDVKDENQQTNNKTVNDNENINDVNNFLFDLYDEDTLNISLEEEKPLLTQLYSSVTEKINSVQKENQNDASNEFLIEFENLFKNQIDIINLCVNNNEPNFIYATNVLVAQIKIFNFFNTKYLGEYLNKSDPESSKILGIINENMFGSVNKVLDIIFKLGKKSNKLNNDIGELHSKLNFNEAYIKQLEDENKIMKEKYDKLKLENELITQKLINNNFFMNNQNENPKNIFSPINSSSRKKPKNDKLKIKLNSYTKNRDENVKNINDMNNIKNNDLINGNNNNKNNDNIINTDKRQNINDNIDIKDFNKPCESNIINNVSLTNLSLAGNRVFTLKMMKEIISNIYSSKDSFDKKCLQNKQPKQTMEEFMYTYLNQKYGLKNMVIEWATNIINGIRTFSPGDTEISLFGKILQNELEESSRFLITNVKENINSIIMSVLRAEYPFKSEIELKKIKKKYIKNEIPPELIQYIINASFDEKGKQIIFDKINKEIDNKRNIILSNSKINGKLSREEYNKIIEQKQIECNSLHYDFLIDICLEYQIRLHIKYLKPFIRLFKIIDSNRDGILDEEQFIDLIKKMNIFGEDIVQQMTEEFLNKLDPYGNKRITFSDIVDLFCQINFDQTQTIMDKYCINENGSGEINNKNNNVDKK